MGQTKEILRDKLKKYVKDFISQEEERRREKNLPTELNDKEIDELYDKAAKVLMNEMDTVIDVDESDLNNSLKDFWNKIITGPNKGKVTSELEGKTDELLERNEYSQKCRQALMNQFKDDIKRELLLDNALKQHFKKDELIGKWKNIDGLTGHRFIDRLYKLPGEDNWERDNERLTYITALCEKAISKETFEAKMTEHYVKYDNMSEKDAREKMLEDEHNPAKQIYDLLDAAIKKGKAVDEECIEASKKILSGEALKEENGLDKAFGTLMKNSSYLGYNGTNEMEVLNGFGLGMDKNEAYKIGLQWEKESSSASDSASMSIHVANPYWTIGDPLELYEKQACLSADNKQVKQNEWCTAYGIDNETIFFQTIKGDLDKDIKRFAMTSGTMTRSPYSNDMFVWGTDDRARIIQQSITTNPRVEVSLRDDIPGKYMDDFLEKRGHEIMDKCDDVTKWYNSSSQFRDMQNALKEVSKFRMDYEAGDKQIDKLWEKLQKLQKATDKYIAKKDKQKKENNNQFKNPYEESRRNFADEVSEFTETTMKMLNNVKKHKATILEAIEAEMDEFNDFKQIDIPDDEKDLTPLQRKDKHKLELEEKQKAELERIEKEKEEREIYGEGTRTYNALNEAEKKNINNEEIKDPVDKYLQDRLEAERNLSESLFDQNEKANAIKAAEKTLALVTIKKMKDSEKSNEKFGQTDRIEKLIKKGGLEDMINLVTDNNDFKTAFNENYKVRSKADLEEFLDPTAAFYQKTGLKILTKLKAASDRMAKNKQNEKVDKKVEVKTEVKSNPEKKEVKDNKPKEMNNNQKSKGRGLGGM